MKRTRMLGLAVGVTAALNAAPTAAQSFGNSVVVGDDEVIVGEPSYEMRTGVVYVFRPDATGAWTETQRLEPDGGSAGDRFGIRLALEGDVLLVSATRADGGSGAVYAFRRNGGRWMQSGRIVTDDRSPADSLGTGLAVDGDWLMVGTIAQNGGRGAVYAFRRSGGAWTQHSKLVPADLQAGDGFGTTIALAGGRALVAAPQRGEHAGAVYAYRYDQASDAWQPSGQLDTSGAGAGTGFGASLDLTGATAMVGAPGFLQGMGMVLVFALDEGEWQAESLLTPFEAAPGTQFGTSITYDGTTAWVGAPGSRRVPGRVYALARDADGEWTESRKVAPDEAADARSFAANVAMSGDVAVAAALGADGGAGAAYVFRHSDEGWTEGGRIQGDVLGADPITGHEVTCSDDGMAAAFSCESVDLLAFLPVQEMGADRGIRMNDIWGWTDPETGREIALVGMTNQLAFVDVTDASNPTYLGRLPMTPGARSSAWRDMKVYKDHAYVVSDGAGDHGMQIFDLTRLRGLDGSDPQTFEADVMYDRIHSAHNIVIDEETGFAYAVGSSAGGETCGGGLHMIDIRSPEEPKFVGCFADPTTGRSRTGYTHDAQCLVYRGPDTEFTGHEVCFGANETALSIADVTDKQAPKALAMVSYPNVAYSHQGWISQDQRYFFMDDELDELGGNVPSTRTLVWDITDLDDPLLVKEYYSENKSTDHNLYVLGNTMYQSNYVSGLRVLDVSEPENPVQVGYLDTVPYGPDEPGFGGSWGNYPFFKSGIVVLTSGSEGLFVVRYRPKTVS